MLCALCGVMMSGCGSFDLFKKSEVKTETDTVQEIVREFQELERFSAEIPVSWIQTIRLPSGTEIDLRESEVRSQQPAAQSDTLGISNNQHPTTNNQVDEPMVRLDYERDTESRDSTSVVEQENRSDITERSTEVDTGSGFTWLFIGIAVALAGIIVLYIYRPW